MSVQPGGSGVPAELAAAGFADAHEIGRGGFGVVYRCRQDELDRAVAVKVLTAHLDAENIERFLREQRAMGRLSGHPNIVGVLQVGTLPSRRPFLVMPLHRQGSLETRVHDSGPLAWHEVLPLGVKLAGALETAHRLGIVHRDVKPANILLTDYGEPALTDFGIARIVGGFETSSDLVAGSPAFTAPEVLQGAAPSPASDVYGLGATLFSALTGHAAFERRRGEEVVSQFLRITRDPVPELRGGDLPDELGRAVERAMSRDAGSRPASAADFGELLREVERTLGRTVDELPVPERGPDESADDESAAASSRASAAVESTALAQAASTQAAFAPPTGGARTSHTPAAPDTKFRPPTPARTLVPRPRLLDRLRAGGDRRLVVVHAPAGFGKTTLVSQWRDVLADLGVATSWLTVDNDDNNVVWFLAHVIEAVRRVRPTLARELDVQLEEHGAQASRPVLTAMINDIHEAGERVALVVDDWHRATSAETVAAMDFLLDNGCHHLRIIVAGQSRSGLPMSRMAVRDELVEIDAAGLRFDAGESREFLLGVSGLSLADEQVAMLQKAAEGWVAALQLASLSLRGAADPARLIRRMSGRHQAIAEYLTENVVAALDAPTVDFLLDTCITERICGDLAASLAGVERGDAWLADLEDRDLFLRRVDDDEQWFRYHSMFAEYLRRRLEHEHPQRLTQLHRTATDWFVEHGMLREAVDHALAAGDDERAAELVEEHRTDLLERLQPSTLLGLAAKLPSQVVNSRPELQTAVVWANDVLQRSTPGKAALKTVERARRQFAQRWRGR